MVPFATRAPNITTDYEYFMLENCTQTTRVYWSKNPIELLHIYIWWNYLRLNRTNLLKFSYISKISIFTSSIGTSPFEVLPSYFRKSHYLKKMQDFSITLLIPANGQFVTIKTSQDEFSFTKTLYHPETTYFIQRKWFFMARYRSPNGPHLLREDQPIRPRKIRK